MILIVFGLPGTGKTYFSKKLAEELDAAHLNTDIIRKRMNLQGQYDEKTKQLVYDQLIRQMTGHVLINDTVILDGTFSKQRIRRECAGEAVKLKQKVYFIEIKASDQTIKKRLQKKRKFSEADYKVYLQIMNEFDPMEKSHLILWSDTQETDEMINRTKKYIDGEATGTYPTG